MKVQNQWYRCQIYKIFRKGARKGVKEVDPSDYSSRLDLQQGWCFIRYSKIDQHLARHFLHYSECLQHPLTFYTTQIINPFLNSRISANQDKVLKLSNLEFLILLSDPLLQNLFWWFYLLYRYNVTFFWDQVGKRGNTIFQHFINLYLKRKKGINLSFQIIIV